MFIVPSAVCILFARIEALPLKLQFTKIQHKRGFVINTVLFSNVVVVITSLETILLKTLEINRN